MPQMKLFSVFPRKKENTADVTRNNFLLLLMLLLLELLLLMLLLLLLLLLLLQLQVFWSESRR
jgi:hypothetical protein